MSFKIPPFISDHFNSLTHEQKQECTDRYKRWYSHEFTEMFISWLEEEYATLLREDEKKSDFVSWFQFSYINIRNKAKRALLKQIINKMKYEV